MKKFAFTLQRMLGYKKSLYEKERNELARLRHERNRIQQQRDNTEAQMLQKDQDFRRKAVGIGVDSNDVNSLSYYRTSGTYFIRELDAQLKQLDIQIAEQLKIVIQLDQDVQGLEKLREKQWEEYQAEAAKEEQERILELVSGKFLATKTEAEADERAEEALRAAQAQ